VLESGLLEPCAGPSAVKGYRLLCGPSFLFPWSNNPFLAHLRWILYHCRGVLPGVPAR